MNLQAFSRLLHMKIISAHKKAKNPFMDESFMNPFSRPIYSTFVWVEADESDEIRPVSYRNDGE